MQDDDGLRFTAKPDERAPGELADLFANLLLTPIPEYGQMGDIGEVKSGASSHLVKLAFAQCRDRTVGVDDFAEDDQHPTIRCAQIGQDRVGQCPRRVNVQAEGAGQRWVDDFLGAFGQPDDRWSRQKPGCELLDQGFRQIGACSDRHEFRTTIWKPHFDRAFARRSAGP